MVPLIDSEKVQVVIEIQYLIIIFFFFSVAEKLYLTLWNFLAEFKDIDKYFKGR